MIKNKVNGVTVKLLAIALILSANFLPLEVQALNKKDTVITSEVEKSSKTTQKGVVNTKSLNIRKGAGTKYSKIGSLSKGDKVQVEGKTSSGWYRIKYKKTYGYVSAKYIKITSTNSSSSSTTSKATKVKYTGTTTGGLNVRKGGSTSYSKIGSLKKGSKLQIIVKLSNGWYKIKYKNTYGYIIGKYVKNVKAINSSNSNSEEVIIKTGTINISSVDVMKKSSLESTKIGTLSKGNKVDITKIESNGWYRIKYNGDYGYVETSYIDLNKERTDLNNFLFVGDSFTYLMKDTIASKNKNVYIHAKSGSMPGYWIDKVSSMPKNSKVDGVVLLIGVNGAGYESNRTDVKILINKLSERYPDKTIYVQKIFPVGRAFKSANPYSFNQKISGLNSVIESHCKKVDNAVFINTTSGFIDNDGYLLNHSGDGLHIASKYNNKFYSNIFNAVKKAEK